MPDTASRAEHEAALTAAVAGVLRDWRDRAPALSGLDHALEVAIVQPLAAIYADAAGEFFASMGLAAEQDGVLVNARRVAESYAPALASELAASMHANVNDTIARIKQEAADASQDEIHQRLIAALLVLMGDERAAKVGITETTRAITTAERWAANTLRGTSSGKVVAVDGQGQVIARDAKAGGNKTSGDKTSGGTDGASESPPQETIGKRLSLTARWRTERDSLVCPACRPLDGKPDSQWGPFRSGPPAHPRCRCYLTWSP